ncbi:hypothetical protein [Novosphingobium sp. MMS21-SN21R]|uniref:hypothetical protein n=1 Tax=Novosphingobium sp. MMS21-SN21R TaxID=2969298 RepID=UPI0028841965|nr:hypothetical protein [Novosphingobium sp. MMS21-SN21R]MDT0508833.1 hypothetical protein [Novosphingobium sp. MMS21-SN21R]
MVIAACAAVAVGSTVPALAETGTGVGTQFELTFWQSVTGSDDPAVYEAYLQQYPAGTFSGLAKAKVANLRKTSPVQPVLSQPQPQPVAVPQIVAATPQPMLVASAPAPVAATPVVATPAVVQTVAVLNTSQTASDAALLTELARSQEVGGGTLPVAASQGFALPSRPPLSAVPELSLPSSFCSAEQRNAFYETRYKPVLDLARANNSAAIAHMESLQRFYDSFQLSRDPQPMNVIAAEASAYQQQVAATTYSRQAALVGQFDALMAVPLVPCAQVAAK